MENWFDKNKFFEKLLVLTWIIFLIICLGLLSFISHAASGSNSLPVQPDYLNTSLPEEDLIELLSDCDTQFNKDFTSGNYFTMFGDYRIFGRYNNIVELQVFVFKIPDTYSSFSNSITESNYNSFIWSNISEGIVCNFDYIRYALKLENGTWTPYGFSYNTANIKYLTEPIENTYFTYKSQVVSYSTTSIYVNSSSNKKVVTLGSNDIIPGLATLPGAFNSPIYSAGDTPPVNVPPQYTINNYSWTTYNPPSVDTTNAETLLASIIEGNEYNFNYLFENLHGELDNLCSNISGLFEYIGSLLKYYGDLIIDNIQNGIQTFYNNMVSLFEPISQKIDYIIEPVDGTVIYDNISTTSLVTNINTINTSLTSFQTSFNDLSEPNSYTIPIHLENLPTAYFGNQSTQYIDLGIIGSTEKTLIRAFMWALITYGLFITIVDSISNYINGGGDES